MSLEALRYAAKSHGGRESAEKAVARILTDYTRSVTGISKSLTREVKEMERELTALPNEITARSVESKYQSALVRYDDSAKKETEIFQGAVRRLSRNYGLDQSRLNAHMEATTESDPSVKAALDNMRKSIAKRAESQQSLLTLIRDLTTNSTGQFYFGTVHDSGLCRRSTSFGKYVLSLS